MRVPLMHVPRAHNRVGEGLSFLTLPHNGWVMHAEESYARMCTQICVFALTSVLTLSFISGVMTLFENVGAYGVDKFN